MRQVDYICIHCTATQRQATVNGILNYWREELGWKNPGYHILIESDGTPHVLQDFDKPTNGVKGFNHNSIHISYIGGLDEYGLPADTRTEAQKAQILNCIYTAIEYAGEAEILGHRDFPNVTKTCPNFDVKREFGWITA